MKKILYVHGYLGSVNGTSINNLRKFLPKEYSIEGVDYNETSCEAALNDIKNYIEEHNIDIVIGTSLGGFLTLMLTDMPRIVVNPCYVPSVELPLINADKNIIDSYIPYENGLFKNAMDLESRICVLGCFGSSDELLGTRYMNNFINDFGCDNNAYVINSTHRISEAGAAEIINLLPVIEARAEKLNKFEHLSNEFSI